MFERKVLERFAMQDGEHELEMFEAGSGSPVVLVVAGQHGDERLAVGVAEQLLELEEVHGTLRVIPEANVFACLEKTRETPWPEYEAHESERRNMNRCFGTARRRLEGEDVPLGLTQRMAYAVLSAVQDSDYLLDLHTATSPSKKVSQVRMKRSEEMAEEVVADMQKMMAHADVRYALETSADELGAGMLASEAPLLDVPAVTMEVGGGGKFERAEFERYYRSVASLLGYIGILERDVGENPPETFHRIRAVYADSPGRAVREVELGQRVSEGDVLVRVEGEEEVDVLEAPRDGVVESLNFSDEVSEGARLVTVAYKQV